MMATWEAGAPLRVEESVRDKSESGSAPTERNRERAGDEKRRRTESQTAKNRAKEKAESKKAQVEEAGEAEAKEARSKKGDGGRRQRCVWTRKTRTAGMEVVQLVFWNPPSPKSAIRDSLQALPSGLPSSLWAGGDRPLAGPRAGTGWWPQYFAQHARGRGGRGTPARTFKLALRTFN